jgi:hypothetical protein
MVAVGCFGMEIFWSAVQTLIFSLLQFVSPAIVELLIG